MYLKYIDFMLIHSHIYVLNINTLQLYFLVYLIYIKYAKLEQLILYF